MGWDYARAITLDSNAAEIEFDSGVYDFSAALGVRLFAGLRAELSYTSARNTPEILYSDSAQLELDSDALDALTTKALMLNVLRDFRVGRAFRPYAGFGLGSATVDLHFSEASVDGLFVQRPRRDIIDDRDTAFAYQLIAGFSVPVRPWLDVAADYRFLRVPALGFAEVDGAELRTGHNLRSVWFRVQAHSPRRTARVGDRSRPKAVSGWYYALRGGGGFTEDMGLENELTIDAFHPGPHAAVALGVAVRNRLRLELEGSYRRSGVEVIEIGPDIGEDAGSGNLKATSLMANALYLFAPDSQVRPYLGLGLGFVHAQFNTEVFGFCASLVCGEERRERFVKDNDNAAAVQAMLGVEVALTRQLKFTADYRYINSARLSVHRPNGDVFKSNFRNTSVVLGVTYQPGAGG